MYMRRTGRSSFNSVGTHLKPSSGSACERPRRKSPAGMKTMPGSAARAASRGKKHSRPLAVNRRDVIRGDVSVGSEWIDVHVGSAGRHVPNFLAPVDAQSGVYGGHDVLRARLLFVVPPGIQALCARRIRAAKNPPTLYARAGEQCGVAPVVVIAAGQMVESARCAPEFAGYHDQRLVQKCLR